MTSDPVHVAHFDGFASRPRLISVPAVLLSDVVMAISDMAELKVTLFTFWAMQQREGRDRYLRREDYAAHAPLTDALAGDDGTAAIDHGLALAVARGTLLTADVRFAPHDAPMAVYVVNSGYGRTVIAEIRRGAWIAPPAAILPERPNVFALYEAHIGPLTPKIGDELKDAAADFSEDWLRDAIALAVENNARDWRYIRKILDRWKKEGRRHATPTRPAEHTWRDYVTGDLSRYIRNRPDDE